MEENRSIRMTLGAAALLALLAVTVLLAFNALFPPLSSGWRGIGAPELSRAGADGAQPTDSEGQGERQDARDTGGADATSSPYLAYQEPDVATGSVDASKESTSMTDAGAAGGQGGQDAADGDPGEPGGPEPDAPGDPDDDSGQPDEPGDSPSDPVPLPTSGWVWGTVTNAASGLPAEGVVVRIQGTDLVTTTGDSGIFIFSHLDVGSVVRVRMQTGGTGWRAAGRAFADVTIEYTGTRVDFTVEPRPDRGATLSPSATARGRRALR